MPSRTRICRITLIAIGAAFACFWFFTREPSYNGRSLSQWLTICYSAETPQALREEAILAVRRIGTNGLPMLLKRASQNPSETKRQVHRYLDQHSVPLAKYLRNWASPSYQTRENEARFGLKILGVDAAPAIPELARLASGSAHLQSTRWAIDALGDVGPPALAALLTIITNPAAHYRAPAIGQIAKFGAQALPAWPTLIQSLQDPDARVACASATVIGDLSLNPEQSLSALLKCLPHPDIRIREAASFSISRLQFPTKGTPPELEEAAAREADPFRKALLQSATHKLSSPPVPAHP